MNYKTLSVAALFVGIASWNIVEIERYNNRVDELAVSAFPDQSFVDLAFVNSISDVEDHIRNSVTTAASPRALFIVKAEQCQSYYEDINVLSASLENAGISSQLIIWSENPNIRERVGVLATRHVNIPVFATAEFPSSPFSIKPDFGAVIILKNGSTYSEMARIISAKASEHVRARILSLLLDSINQST